MTNTRRSLLLALTAVPVVTGTAALATIGDEADAGLIQDCRALMVLEAEADPTDESPKPDDVDERRDQLVDAIVSARALTRGGLSARAQALEVFAAPRWVAASETSTEDRLLAALLRDLGAETSDGAACAPPGSTTAI
ncbi:hypothetical protein [Methylobacterium oxalidis]|uniref:Secreted protein n=1 Tax=Methylobacterium oxalidis TaxID=944322 RepID=A0A512J9N3_9HYPH|nr:hypothetical protein [Methylobacterium oxalidis]GEP06625.1 hypothetical protein MOX02_46630 [Methylobacterium oxalidis]